MKKICKCCGNDPDEVVQSVVNKFRQRSAQGIESYGMTMADNPAPLDKWIEDIQEELMDAILYIERLKQEVI